LKRHQGKIGGKEKEDPSPNGDDFCKCLRKGGKSGTRRREGVGREETPGRRKTTSKNTGSELGLGVGRQRTEKE